MATQFQRIYEEFGIKGLALKVAALLYKRGIRPFLPTSRRYFYAGLPVAVESKWGDRIVPNDWKPDGLEDRPNYEAALVNGLRQVVSPGHHVVVVGGGVGVTAVVAALLAGEQGRVTCFEAGGRGVRAVRRSIRLNDVVRHVDVRHAAVGRRIMVYGPEWRRQAVRPEELPRCDVLQLDCEGSELGILQHLTISPSAIVVETHGIYGAPTAAVASLLEERGYSVTDEGVAEPDLAALCEELDIRVLVGRRRDACGAADERQA